MNRKTQTLFFTAIFLLGTLAGFTATLQFNNQPAYELKTPVNGSCPQDEINVENVTKYYLEEQKICLDPAANLSEYQS